MSTLPRIHIDVGDVHAIDPVPTGVWDDALWDTDPARWGGTMPNWTEVSCRVRRVEITRGRATVLQIFEAGRATIEVANDDGWATWSTTAPSPVTAGSWIRVRADDDPLFCGIVRRVVDQYVPGRRPGAQLVAVDPLARLATVELPARPTVGAGDTAAERIGRILDEVGWVAELRDLDPGGPVLTATNLEGSMADQAQQAAVSAGGHLWCSCGGVMVYRDAGWLRTHPRSTIPQAIVTNVPSPEPPPEPPPSVAHNLLASDEPANMETGTTSPGGTACGWEVPFPARQQVARSTVQAREGLSSLAVTATSQGVAARVAAPHPPVTPGHTLTVVASVWQPAGGPALSVSVGWFDATGAAVTGPPAVGAASTPDTWQDHRFNFVIPENAATARPMISGGVIPAGAAMYLDRVAVFDNDPDAEWALPSDWPPPEPVTPPPEICATGMQVNGPDIERVINTVTYAGRDDHLPDDDPVEVTRLDAPSRRRYGPATWSVDGLFTTDPDQLDILARRVLALRANPQPWVESLDLSPVADPRAAELCKGVEFGDRLVVTYQDRLGWSWSFDVHVHGIAYRILPSGDDNQAREWTTTLTLDNAATWQPGVAWDAAGWDLDIWSAPYIEPAAGDEAGPVLEGVT
jgi:hypothetical protein